MGPNGGTDKKVYVMPGAWRIPACDGTEDCKCGEPGPCPYSKKLWKCPACGGEMSVVAEGYQMEKERGSARYRPSREVIVVQCSMCKEIEVRE